MIARSLRRNPIELVIRGLVVAAAVAVVIFAAALPDGRAGVTTVERDGCLAAAKHEVACGARAPVSARL